MLLSYNNVKIRRLNYENYIKDTPLEHFYKSRKLESSKYSFSHASDILRYLSLWKYGGLYLDLDVIVLKSLENLPPNYAGYDSENIAVGVLNFAATGPGHHLAELCVDDLKHNFNGDTWGHNGPGVISRFVKFFLNFYVM